MNVFKMPEKIIYALPETIGNPDLFVGRKAEFDFFLGDWYRDLEGNFAQNQAIISRRKKGKTAFLQRLFNVLWSACRMEEKEGPEVIPFYFSIQDTPITLGKLSTDFFTAFVKCCMAYNTKDPKSFLLSLPLDLLKEKIKDKELKSLCETFETYRKRGDWESMWDVASKAPANIARVNGVKIVQILDEFQNINDFVYDKDKEKITGMSGTYMYVSELREAPVIVSGSEVHWLLRIVGSLTGRFQTYSLENLHEEEAKEAMNRYADFRKTKINKAAKEKLWNLTRGDPLYIKALFMSRYNTKKDYTKEENIVKVYEKELEPGGEIYNTWMEYMQKTFHDVNRRNSKRIMLYLFNKGEERTRAQIIKDLNLKMSDEELEKRLNALIAGDLISQGSTGYRYRIPDDKTYELLFRGVYQDEIENFVPDIRKEIRKELGKTNYEKGKFREYLVKERLKKPFNLKEVTEEGPDRIIKPRKIEERVTVDTGARKREIDLLIKAEKGLKIYIDVKNTKQRYGKNEMKRWLRIAENIREEEPETLFMVYSKNGYTEGTKETMKEAGVLIVKSF